MDALFDLMAPVVIDAVAFAVRFWPSLLVAAVMVAMARKGVRAPRLPLPPPALAYALVCALSLASSAVTLHFRGEPRMPGYEDDFGYLLSADTFLHGRLTNPQHPLWRHFETVYTLYDPTYSSMYLPGNGLFLALGRLVAGRALIGMWMATALAALAIFWALRGWVSGGWAFALGCVVAVHPTMAEWSNSFHGGSVTALGGALVAGAAGRLRREPRTIDGALFGLGAVLLGITRPYEGVMIGVPFAAIVMASGQGRRLFKPALVAMAITASGAAAIMAMNRAVTGDALKLPYRLYKERYTSAPLFIWQTASEPLRIERPEIGWLDRHYRNYHARNREPREFLRTVYAETAVLLRAAIPAPQDRWSGMGRAADSLRLLEILPFAVFLLAAFRHRTAAWIGVALAVELAALLALTGFTQVHYAAPAAGAFAIAMGIGAERLAAMRREGEWLSRAAWGAMLFAAVVGTVGSWQRYEVSERTRMIAALMKSPGPHLVLVSEDCLGFVRNGAEIDAQRIIWARDLGANDALLQRYAGRSLWAVRCDGAGRLQFVRPPLRAESRRTYERDPFVP